jgi:hypothetical protein
MPKSPKARKESSKREREEGRMSDSERVPEPKDPQVEAKNEIKAKK